MRRVSNRGWWRVDETIQPPKAQRLACAVLEATKSARVLSRGGDTGHAGLALAGRLVRPTAGLVPLHWRAPQKIRHQ